MNQNPYAAPSSGAGSQPDEAGALRYSGFWQRVGAYLIDFLIAVPLVALDYLVGGSTHLYPLYVFIPGVCFGLFIHVYMVYRFGGSPGKLVLGLRIAMQDGSRVTLQATMLRYAVLFLIALSTGLLTAMIAMKVPNEVYTTLSYLQRGQELVANAPGWFKGLAALTQLWALAGLISIIANRKRRAIHDFIAGTVVLRK
ncbi:RDD family protein [Massilia sp. CF038]|uniref:RDD family protein n=1 Tax=Massilia sp. CF038 TaxID=1881045 RepID=UPI000912BCBE|nr:RDD family protein [Massilia sp. CF038]SHG49196.1 RDD family protein [Massilia sp. CF038]